MSWASIYDPRIENRHRISGKILGKLPAGEMDLRKMVPVLPRSPNDNRTVNKIIKPVHIVNDPHPQA